MTFQLVLDQYLLRIRSKGWADPNTYLKLPLLPDGQYGPWAELYDCDLQYKLGIEPGSQRLSLMTLMNDDADWEVYTGTISEYEKGNEEIRGEDGTTGTGSGS